MCPQLVLTAPAADSVSPPAPVNSPVNSPVPVRAPVRGAAKARDSGDAQAPEGAALAAPARLLSITGARGGLGASTFLIHLAWALRRGGRRVAMVDLDPAGGLGLLLGDEHRPGLRWADLPAEESSFRPGRLIGALPTWHAIPFLTGDGRGGARLAGNGAHPARGDCLDAVLTALLSEHDVVLLDLPRGMEPPRGSEVMLVTGLDLRSAVACEALISRLRGTARGPDGGQWGGCDSDEPGAARIKLVLRQVGEDVSIADLELITDSPVVVTLPTDRAIRQRILRGEDPLRSRSAMRRQVGALVRSWPSRAELTELPELTELRELPELPEQGATLAAGRC